jgi:hypothetical protein
MRWLLGVGIVQGSVHVERAGDAQHVVLLAGSNRDESWQVSWPPRPQPVPPQPATWSPQPEDANDHCVSRWDMEADANHSAGEGKWLPLMVENLAHEFAFQVSRADTALGPAFTRSWTALSCFKKGLQAWQKF